MKNLKNLLFLVAILYLVLTACKKRDSDDMSPASPKDGDLFYYAGNQDSVQPIPAVYFYQNGKFKESNINYDKALKFNLETESTLGVRINKVDQNTTDYILASKIPISYNDYGIRGIDDKNMFNGLWAFPYNGYLGRFLVAFNANTMLAKLYFIKTKQVIVKKYHIENSFGDIAAVMDSVITDGKPEKLLMSCNVYSPSGRLTREGYLNYGYYPYDPNGSNYFASAILVDDKRN